MVGAFVLRLSLGFFCWGWLIVGFVLPIYVPGMVACVFCFPLWFSGLCVYSSGVCVLGLCFVALLMLMICALVGSILRLCVDLVLLVSDNFGLVGLGFWLFCVACVWCLCLLRVLRCLLFSLSFDLCFYLFNLLFDFTF